MSYQHVVVVGRLGDDPELNQTQGGTSVTNLSVATSRKYQDRNGNTQEETFWHDVVVWGGQAENCAQYLSQGRRVCVEGRLEKDEYTDRNGVDRTSVRLRARSVTFLGGGDQAPNRQGKPKQKPSPGNPQANNQQAPNSGGPGAPAGGQGGGWPDEEGEKDPFDDDDIPF